MLIRSQSSTILKTDRAPDSTNGHTVFSKRRRARYQGKDDEPEKHRAYTPLQRPGTRPFGEHRTRPRPR